MPTSNRRLGFSLVERLLIIVIIAQIGLLAAMVILSFEKANEAHDPVHLQELENEERALYSAWKRAHNSDLTFEEWKALRKSGMLPK